MPITPLHFGLMAPINHAAPRRVSGASFVLANVCIDSQAIIATIRGLPLPGHECMTHTLLGAMIIAALVAMPGIRSPRWVLGAFMGGFSHVALDSLVHMDMNPLYPLKGNPFYLGGMAPVSWVLLPLTVWFIAQSVSGVGRFWKRWLLQ